MSWHIVAKTINGRRFLYRQMTWREGRRMRTRSEYIGPVDGAMKRKSRGRSRSPASAVDGVTDAIDQVVEAVAGKVAEVGITLLG